MTEFNSPTLPVSGTFSDRIKLLIQRVGSASEIARMCGFSEGVVRSWRDGNTDPSRARCVTLARTLGISLIWLVAGEGAIQTTPTAGMLDDQRTAETVTSQRSRTVAVLPGRDVGVDTPRLNTAMTILQSELDLAGSPLSLADNTDLLVDLYGLLGPGGTSLDTSAMLAFNRRLSERIRQSRQSA